MAYRKKKEYSKDVRKDYSLDEKMDYHVDRFCDKSKSEYKRAYSSGWISGAALDSEHLNKEAKKLEDRYQKESAYYDNVKKDYDDAKNTLKEASKLKKKTFSEMMGLRAGNKAFEKDRKKK